MSLLYYRWAPISSFMPLSVLTSNALKILIPESKNLRFSFLSEDILTHFYTVGPPAWHKPGNTFPKALMHRTPQLTMLSGKPSGLVGALASLSLTFCPEILFWTRNLPLSDSFAKTGIR